MARLPDESAGQSQAHGCSPYPLSFPSEPPDIRNWFSSYQYESPEVPELDADPGGDNGSETQDPVEYGAPLGHPFLKHASQGGGTALKGNCFGSRSVHDEVSAAREFLPIGRSTVEQGTKRKRSLRELFGPGFLDDLDEDTETENAVVLPAQRSAVVLPVQRSAVDPMCNFNWIGLQNIKRSHEGTTEHNELLADSDGTIIAETQENPLGGQETDHGKWPVNCCGTSLAADTEEGFLEGGIEPNNLPVHSHSKSLADTGKTDQSLRELFGAGLLDDHGERSAVNPLWNCNWVGLRNRKCNHEGTVEYSDLPMDSESTCIAETQENPLGGQQTDHSKRPVNCGGSSLADTEEGFLEDVIERSNWIGLQNRNRNYEGAVEHNDLRTDSESTIVAETQENPLGDQETDCRKSLVNCGGTSLADTEEGLLEDRIEHNDMPVDSHSKGLTDTGKTKRSLWELFRAGFLDDHDDANNVESLVVSAVQGNAVEPLSNCNAAGLPHIDQIHEGAAGNSKLLADCDVISAAETQENPLGGQVIEHNRLSVNCGGTSLAADTEEGFLEDVIKHNKLLANSHSACAADMGKTSIEHSILHANHNGIGLAIARERSGGDEANHGKPTLNHKKAEAIVAADGFIAIRTKVKPAEECRANKTHKPSRRREAATLQENRVALGTQNASSRDRTRSPLSDRTNLLEVAGAPAPEISGKWKCPRKGKPYVAPPMKQLRLEQWVRRVD